MSANRVVSLWQPHASLVVCNVNGIAEKRIEARHFETNIRERVYIHAAKKWDRRLWDLARTPIFAEALRRHGYWLPQEWKSAAKSGGNLPFGAIIGEVDWLDCVQMLKPGVNFLPVSVRGYQDLLTPKECAFGNHEPGRWAHILGNPERYEKPIPFKGRQDFGWKLDQPLEGR